MADTEDKKKKIPEFFSGQSWKTAGAFLLAFIVLYTFSYFMTPAEPPRPEISYSQMLQLIEDGKLSSVTIDKFTLQGELIQETSMPVVGKKESVRAKKFLTNLPPFQSEDIMRRLAERNVVVTIKPEERPSIISQIFYSLLPFVFLIAIWMFILKRSQQIQGGPGGLFTFGASKAKLYDTSRPKVTYNEVAGMDNVKQELRETIEFLKDPDKFRRLGAKVPKGVLLIGPPGTGKTLLARATAGEAGVPFYSISASEFIEMFVGVGASRVRDMFKKARANQPSIIFIDEIDAVGRTRGAGLGGGHDEREQTLNQLLSEMDGFEPHDEVIIMAATNRPDVLDPALLRPGRFDRRVVLDRPGWKERKLILEVHVRNKPLADDVNLETIARGTPGMTGADLENLANEATLLAVRKNKDRVEMSDFDEARDIILMGAVREESVSELEKRITAYHEAGHALVAHFLPYTDPIHKISIIPRGMAMGVTQLLPDEDRHYYPKAYLMNRLSVAMGGRVAERLIFNDLSSGAQSDIKEATNLAEKMVAQWGMSDVIGPVNLGRGEEHPFLGRELAAPKRYSEDMAWRIDQEIQRTLLDAEKGAVEVIESHRTALTALAEALIREELIDREDIDKIIGSAESRNNPSEVS